MYKPNDKIMHSKDLENFLNLLRSTEEQHNIHYDNVDKCNNEQNNMVHDFEFLDLDYKARAKLGTKFTKLRKERRFSKDTVEMASDVVQFCKENQAFVKKMEQLLGRLRKKEKDLENRTYNRR